MKEFQSNYSISSAAVEVLGQLFVKGPTWDGNIASKSGRGDLVRAGLAMHVEGWAFLNEDGVRAALEWDVRHWHDQRWHRKQKCID